EAVIGNPGGGWALTTRGSKAVYDHSTIRLVKFVFQLKQWRVVREEMRKARAALGVETHADLWIELLACWMERQGRAAADVARLRALARPAAGREGTQSRQQSSLGRC